VNKDHQMRSDFSDIDVIVVGAGNAALVAALSANEAGSKVLVLESASQFSMGGNSRFTLGGFRFGYRCEQDVLQLVPNMSSAELEMVCKTAYSPDDFAATLVDLSKGEADESLCRFLAEGSLPVVKWLARHNVTWNLRISGIEPEPMWLASPGNVYATGRGPGLISALLQSVQQAGIEVLYQHEFKDLVFDGSHRVESLVVSNNGILNKLPCRSIVLACGGFEANREKTAELMGLAWSSMRVRGTSENKGAGIFSLLKHGAQAYGQWNNGHAVPVASDAPSYGNFQLGETTRRCLFQYGISVNQAGKRFMDEGSDKKTFMYSTTGLAVANQNGRRAFQIFDKRIDSANFELAFYKSGAFHSANTIGELALKIGISPKDLVTEVEAYNSAVISDERFDTSRLDGSSTRGLTPNRSNFAARILHPPFYAFEVVGGLTFTFGGVRIDTRCRVLRVDGTPIHGVFAAGEMAAGFFAHTYPANAGLTRGAVTGWQAGRSAADYVDCISEEK
jgi:tricarballylate dehydrogenase